MGNPDASRKPFHRRLLSHFLTIVVAYLLVLALVRMFESHLIFFPNYPGRLDGDWHPRALPVQDVWLTASDGVKLHAWWIPHDNAKFTFLAFHGNASNMANRAPTLRISPQHTRKRLCPGIPGLWPQRGKTGRSRGLPRSRRGIRIPRKNK